jgi:hypothetical protein
MRRDRVVVQEWDLSCGAAAVTTLLNFHFDDPVSEKEVATALIRRKEYIENPSIIRHRHGFSLLDLKQFVEGRGYRGVGYGLMAIDDLIEHAPVIVPIDANGYNHFVIFRGAAHGRVLLADPAWGNRTMTAAKFERLWIDYGNGVGKVGFVVLPGDGGPSPGGLEPAARDFLVLR